MTVPEELYGASLTEAIAWTRDKSEEGTDCPAVLNE